MIDILGTILGGGGGRRGGGNRRGGGGGSWPPPITTGGGSGGVCTGCSSEDYARADHYLHDMANVTGGRLYRADSTRNLVDAEPARAQIPKK